MKLSDKMAAIPAATLALACAIAPLTTTAQEYLPKPCIGGSNAPPSTFHCPTPYREMVAAERDLIFDRAWHCPETGYSLGHVRESPGRCGGWKGEIDGWSIPAEAAEGIDLEAEIVTSIVDPCIVAMADARPEFADIPDDQLVALMKEFAPGSWDEMTAAVVPLVAGKPKGVRMTLYGVLLKQCIETNAR